MRELPHPLTVIVAQSKNSPRPAGLLVSSFNTVTLEPVPHVSFNLKLPSATYDQIRKAGTFTASAITDVQLAKDFLLDKEDPGYAAALKRNVTHHRNGMLAQLRGGIWWMRCSWLREKDTEVGDHIIVVGKVTAARFYPDRNKDGRVRGQALIYSKGRYRYAGTQLDKQ